VANGSLITDDLRKLVGVTLDTIIFKVEEGAIQRYAEAIDDPNPLFNELDYARKTKYGRLLAPPGFTGWPVKAGRLSQRLLGSLTKAGAPSRLLDGGVEFEFAEPIGAGDLLTATTKIASMTERETKLGKTIFTVLETTFVNERGDVALRSRSTFILF
jgi:acyl dehydratase